VKGLPTGVCLLIFVLVSREVWSETIGYGATCTACYSSALASHWRREVLRTSLWLVPAIEVFGAVALFAGTLLLDRGRISGRVRRSRRG